MTRHSSGSVKSFKAVSACLRVVCVLTMRGCNPRRVASVNGQWRTTLATRT